LRPRGEVIHLPHLVTDRLQALEIARPLARPSYISTRLHRRCTQPCCFISVVATFLFYSVSFFSFIGLA
jgi:hypothetical protein